MRAPGKRRVLVVAVDAVLSARLFDCMEDAGWRVVALNPLEAVQAGRAVRPDLLLSQLYMKGRSGIEVMEQIRSRVPELLTIFLSPRVDDRLRRGVISAGAGDLVAEASLERDLPDAVRNLVGSAEDAIGSGSR